MSDWAQAKITFGNGKEMTLLQFVKQRQCVSPWDESQDDELTLYLQIAGEAAEAYTDNKLCPQTVTENIARARSPINARYWPVNTLTTVEVNGEDVTANWALFADEGIQWIEATNSAPDGGDFEQMVVTYECGFDPLPAELGNVIVNASMSYQEGSGANVKKESVVGIGSIEYVAGEDFYGGFSSAALSVLDRYASRHV